MRKDHCRDTGNLSSERSRREPVPEASTACLRSSLASEFIHLHLSWPVAHDLLHNRNHFEPLHELSIALLKANGKGFAKFFGDAESQDSRRVKNRVTGQDE